MAEAMDLEPVKGLELLEALEAGNLVEELENPVDSCGDILALLSEAEQSMDKWKKKYELALKLAKLEPETEKKTFPFRNASTVMMPFIMEAMLDFHSRTVPELVWSKNVVSMATYGEKTEGKQQRAERVGGFMNWQVKQGIPTWRKEQDKMLLALPCVGTSFKETYYDYDEQEAASDLLLADEVIFDHNCRTFDEAPEKFVRMELTRNEVIQYIRGHCEWDLEEEEIESTRDHPQPWEFVRAYCWLDIDGDGLDEPYEVIIYCEKEKIVSVRPAYDEDSITTNDDGEIVKIEMVARFTQYQFLPDPEGGPMGMGWGVLFGDLFKAMNTTVRQMIDAGTLANVAGNSGLIDQQMGSVAGRGNRQQTGPIEVKMGELTPVTTGGKPLGQSIVQFPYSGPNATLYQLTEWMLTQLRSMTASALNLDTNSQEAAMMYLARLQQGLKVPNSIVMRVYNAAAEEFSILGMINHKHFNNSKYQKVLDDEQATDMEADFDPEDCDIAPATDPSQGTDIERQQRASIILEEAKTQTSQVLNVREAYLQWLDALKIPDEEAEILAPEPSGEPPPMEQMMMANLAREAELAERDMQLKEAKQELDRMEAMLKHAKEATALGIDIDVKESQIMNAYADAMKKLWEIGVLGDDPAGTVEDFERRFIDKAGEMDSEMDLDSPDPTPTQMQMEAAEAAPTE